MREIKFRAWDTKQKKMLNGVSIGTIKVWDENTPLLSNEFSYNEDCIFEQYTGLKDENGKEIYEGDIVKARWRRAKHAKLDTMGEVRFGDGWFYIDDDPDGRDRLGVPIHNCYNIEVIGNIHENPESLKGENYRPVEPLIKDDKIRKAVRAWWNIQENPLKDAGVLCKSYSGISNNKDHDGFYNYCIYGYVGRSNINLTATEFEFRTKTYFKYDRNKNYTLSELCGEEEE